jgi:uncharacterized protein with von Willebrand factor type A (vWA) domain
MLPFWHFFHRIEKELSYERWIDKYTLFLKSITDAGLLRTGDAGSIIPDGQEAEFRRFCKFLYLQDHQHERRFDELLTEAIETEAKMWRQLAALSAAAAATKEPQPAEPAPAKPPITPPVTPPPAGTPKPPAPEDTEQTTISGESTLYFKPGAAKSWEETDPDQAAGSMGLRYLHSDEYFPLTRREMTKSWQYLRLKEKRGFQQNLDVAATVRHIAVEGIVTEPIFQTGYANRGDTIIILADTRGSMTPFEGLTDRLIETARGAGGHPNAPVFYFQNYPTGYLYRKRNLSEPVKITEAFLKCNPAVTYAIIISDAGAARGNTDAVRVQQRTAMTRLFLAELQKYAARIIWLNPMPVHRWKDTAAARILDGEYGKTAVGEKPPPLPDVMLSVLDDNSFHFQTALHLVRLNKR